MAGRAPDACEQPLLARVPADAEQHRHHEHGSRVEEEVVHPRVREHGAAYECAEGANDQQTTAPGQDGRTVGRHRRTVNPVAPTLTGSARVVHELDTNAEPGDYGVTTSQPSRWPSMARKR